MYYQIETMKADLESVLLEADLETAWLGLVQAVDRIGAAANRVQGERRERINSLRRELSKSEKELSRMGFHRERLKAGVIVAVTPTV